MRTPGQYTSSPVVMTSDMVLESMNLVSLDNELGT